LATHVDVAAVIQALFAGVATIILAVLVSAVLLGSYGWGLFVLTPFMVGVTTSYVANRRALLPEGHTWRVVLAAAGLGCLSLVLLALEGIVCILMAAPLGAVVAVAGGELGRAIARSRHRDGATPLVSIAILPAVFMLEAAMPPSVTMTTQDTIDISAPPAEVWRALTSSSDIGPGPGLVFRAGLAYPIRGRILSEGVGAERLGQFSTGTARERITDWVPGRKLAFAVLTQPPAMAEFSPFDEVHAPHVRGYFETKSTSFELRPLPGGRTELVASGSHVLRLDPVLYWEPMARWTIHQNTRRVLQHIRDVSQKEK
jgi:hypothetical protein